MDSASVVRLVTGVAWPLTVVVGVFALRRSVARAISSLSQGLVERGGKFTVDAKKGQVSLQFREELKEADVPAVTSSREAAEKALAVELSDGPTREPLVQIILSYTRLEDTFRRLVGTRIPGSASEDVVGLTFSASGAGLISYDVASAIRSLRLARSTAIKDPLELTLADALAYATRARAIEMALDTDKEPENGRAYQ